jgi:hypothetical protein
MTSDAKGNHSRISRLLADNNWFGRTASSYRLFRYTALPASVLASAMGCCILSVPRLAAASMLRCWLAASRSYYPTAHVCSQGDRLSLLALTREG